MRRIAVLVVAGFCMASCAAEKLILWPSDMSQVTAHRDSSMTMDGVRVCVKVGEKPNSKEKWPGITVAFPERKDLRTYERVMTAVTNLSDKPVRVCVSVKSHPHGQRDSSVELPPHGFGIVRDPIYYYRVMLDKPLEIEHMRGYPRALTETSFRSDSIASVHVFVNEPKEAKSFALLGMVAVGNVEPQITLKSDAFFPFVDEFGQFKHVEWPGKIHSEAELKQAKVREDGWLAQHGNDFPDRDKWGGWAKGPKLEATGFFRTQKVNGTWWLVDPDGRLFFSHGIDCIGFGQQTGVELREKYFEALPDPNGPFKSCYGTGWGWGTKGVYKAGTRHSIYDFHKANRMRIYGDKWLDEFCERAHRRLKAWGVNTVANWSNPNVYLMHRTPYTVTFSPRGPMIEGSGGYWGKFRDPFSKEFEESLKAEVEKQRKEGTTSDPWCIGFFVDNELSWGDEEDSLGRATVSSPAKQPAKQRMLRWLQEKYGATEKLNAAWETKYGSWTEMMESTNVPSAKLCVADLEAFHQVVAEKYFKTIADAIHSVTPQRLYLGCRIAWGRESIFRISAKYCDVVSVNTYKLTPERDLPEGSADKPMIVGEFHFGAMDRGMLHTGLVLTTSQQERASCYRKYVEYALRHPRYIGTHWFQWQDQPLTGRFDAENYQIGFLDVCDQPYPELVEAARKVGSEMYRIRFSQGK